MNTQFSDESENSQQAAMALPDAEKQSRELFSQTLQELAQALQALQAIPSASAVQQNLAEQQAGHR